MLIEFDLARELGRALRAEMSPLEFLNDDGAVCAAYRVGRIVTVQEKWDLFSAVTRRGFWWRKVVTVKLQAARVQACGETESAREHEGAMLVSVGKKSP